MKSAFGVDHGEVSKAFGMRMAAKLGSGLGRGAQTAGTNLMAGGARTAMRGAQGGGMRGAAQYNAGRAGVKIGGRLTRLGQGASRRPGMTGGLAAGGVTAGMGGAGYMATRKKPAAGA